MDDKTALEDMRQGGEAGIEMLYKHYFPKLRSRVIWLLTKKYNISLSIAEIAADEICQDTFFYDFYKKIDLFKEECSVMTWLLKLATNKTIDYLRKEPKTENLQPEQLEEAEESFFEFDAQEEKRFCYVECIGHALKRQGTNEPDCLTALIFSFPKASIDKIANELGISHKEAKVLLNRCKRKFKESQDCLMALMLFYALGLSQKEMAKMLGKKENDIAALSSKCRKKLKDDANFRSCCEDCGYLLPKEKDDVNER
ncbi:hypothetical protein BGP_2033 [Beggiatoa sp. PS]|nr:hypothetical protein BGP_2033 [Beggiatoa sp. PS]